MQTRILKPWAVAVTALGAWLLPLVVVAQAAVPTLYTATPVTTAAPTATAAPLTERDILIKPPGQGAPVYYLATDDRRYVFPNQRTYETWFRNFEGITEVTLDQLAGFMIGGNVTYRPGIRMVKITTDPKVYAVGQRGCLHWVTSETIATELYGSDWNQKIDDVPDAFFFDYQVCDPIYSVLAYQPLAVAQDTPTINALKYLNSSKDARRADTQPDIGDATPRSCTTKADTTEQGLVVSAADAELPAHRFILLGGESEASLGAFELKSELEDMKLERVGFKVTPAATIASLSLYVDGRLVSGPQALDKNGAVRFQNLNQFIANSQTVSIEVKGQVAPYTNTGLVRSGQGVTLTFLSDYFSAKAALSCSETAIDGGGVLGERLPLEARERVIRRTRPTLSLEPLATSGLANGEPVLLRFAVAADEASDLAFQRLTAHITGSSEVALSLKAVDEGLYDVAAQAGLPGEYRLSGTCLDSRQPDCNLSISLTEWELVPAGTSQTYEIRLGLTGGAASGVTLETRLEGDFTPNLMGHNSQPEAYNFVWADLPLVEAGALKVYDWVNGAYVTGLPSEWQTVSR
jgi:hypothetical protein